MSAELLFQKARLVLPLAALRYAESRGWKTVAAKGNTDFYLLEHPEWRLRQLVIPESGGTEDYGEAIIDVANRLAASEQRTVEAIIDELLLPASDQLRFRVASNSALDGSLALNSAINLIEGIRVTLLSAACTVHHPRRHHPRMAWREAAEFIEDCRIAQTEQGSYVVKIICPILLKHGLDFVPAHEPFARSTALVLLTSCQNLAHAIDDTATKSLYESEPSETQVSANLCEGLLRIHNANEDSDLDISAEWASAFPRPDSFTDSETVTFTPEHFPAIQQVYDRLRFPKRVRQSQFVGLVISLEGNVRRGRHPAGEVTLRVIYGENEVNAKVRLDTAQYRAADAAHMSGRRVSLSGVLHLGRRLHRIEEVSEFTVLDDQ